MARKTPANRPDLVDHGILAKALAKAVAEGDIINFRMIFAPYSPARLTSTEDFGMEKYAYLLPSPDGESSVDFQEALAQVRQTRTWERTLSELDTERPPRLPAELVLRLADNAIRKGKYTAAAQAYELLRIRKSMQDEFLKQADGALDTGHVEQAVRGYLMATGLAYDYAAFPEPLPVVPNHQTAALMLHGEYPRKPEDCISLQEPEIHVSRLIEFLLGDPDAATRLAHRSLEDRLAFARALVEKCDPKWSEFTTRYHEAVELTRRYGERLQTLAGEARHAPETLAEEIDEQKTEDADAIMECLLGRRLEEKHWWQYLKELACEHPAGVLFVSRQALGEDEIIVPRHRPDSPLVEVLGLLGAAAGSPT